MKRLLAAFLAVLCCLTLLVPTAWAAPEEGPDSTVGDEAPADTPAENLPEETPAETPAETPEPPVQDPLSGETAIRSVEITVVVDQKGKASVTQVVQMNVVGTLEEIRFAFPGTSKNRAVEGWKTKASSENDLRYLTVRNKAGFTGDQSFTLTYTQDDLVTAGTESQILTLPLLVAQDYRVGRVALAVNLPQEFTTYPSFSSGYYKEIIEDYMDFETTGKAVTAVVNDILQDSDSLTMALTLPDGYFSGSFGAGMMPKVIRGLVIAIVVLTLLFWWRTLRNAPLRVQTRTLPPDGVNPGDLPFLIAGGDTDFNMLVSYWATLGYLSFYINKSGNVILRRRMDMGNERRPFERKLFALLFGNDTMCDGASMRYKKVGERAMAVVPHYWGKRLYDRRSGSPFLAKLLCGLACALSTVLAMDAVAPDKAHGFFLVIGFVAGFALCWLLLGAFGAYYLSEWVKLGIGVCCGLLLLILGGLGGATAVMLPAVALTVLIAWQTTHGGRRSSYGTEVISQTMGFRRFMLHVSEHHLQQMLRRDPQYFYKLLPYAEAMGQGRRFVAMFQDARLEPCPWYETARGTPTTATSFYDHYLETLDMLNISIRK